jgi:hypothetical protein|tara:strand:+ start:9429 stop:9578 length:150 start_codon:yes stop_codon:yes gene_type:complete
MNIECPKCGKDNELDGEDLPDCACDDQDYECQKCEHVFKIGWSAEAELR